MNAHHHHPVRFVVDYPDRPLNRLTTAFRVFTAIPIVILLCTVSGGSFDWSSGDTRTTVATAGGLLVLGPLLMILFRARYPRWWFDWNLQLLRLHNRINVYLLLLRDEYPSTDEDQAVHLDVPYPDAIHLSRWLPLVKWLLAIPHYIVLALLNLIAALVTVVAWFAILFTGHYPRGLFEFVVGVLRWNNRVIAYAFILATDAYPPFRLSP
jgi:hypothetical protein